MNLLMSLVSSALVIRTGFLVQSLRSIDITYSDAETTALFILLTLNCSWAELLFNNSIY